MSDANAAFEPIVRLSGRLLRQLGDFGLFSIDRDPLAQAKQSGFGARLELLSFLLDAFDEKVDGGLSVIYNLTDWGDEAPIAHYPPRPCTIASRRIALSLLETWALDGQNEGRPSAHRFVRGALYFWSRDGMPAAVSFLFGLAASGFMTDYSTFDDCLELLLKATSGADDDFLLGLYGGNVPRKHQEWRNRKPLWPTSIANEPGPTARALLEEVATQAVDLTEGARNATTYDDWLRIQYQLWAVLPGVVHRLEAHAAVLPVALRAVAAQLEEIKADSFVVANGGRRDALQWLLAQWAPLGATFANEIARVVGDEWRDRYVNERALLPRRFATALLGTEGDPAPFSQAKASSLPPEATALSPALAMALVAANGFSSKTLSISRGAAAGVAATSNDMADLEQSRSLKMIGHPELALDVETRANAQHPWSAVHYFARAETLLLLDRAPDALASIEEALLVEPCASVFWTLYARVLGVLGRNEAAAFAQMIALKLEGATEEGSEPTGSP